MMREKQKELNGSIQEVMDQMAERRYGKRHLYITSPVTSF